MELRLAVAQNNLGSKAKGTGLPILMFLKPG
jgi:hypothetical protein